MECFFDVNKPIARIEYLPCDHELDQALQKTNKGMNFWTSEVNIFFQDECKKKKIIDKVKVTSLIFSLHIYIFISVYTVFFIGAWGWLIKKPRLLKSVNVHSPISFL